MFSGKLCFWVVALSVCTADLWTKAWAFDVLGVSASSQDDAEAFNRSAHFHVESYWGDRLRLVALFNPGMMWGKFSNHGDLLLVFRLLSVVVVLALLRGTSPAQTFVQSALGGILGGAVGNIHDSLRYVGVRDFLEIDLGFFPFHPFPAFNLADSAICLGVGVLAIGMFRRPRAEVDSAGERRPEP